MTQKMRKFLLLLCILALTLCLFSCDFVQGILNPDKGSNDDVDVNAQRYFDITNSLTLTKSYAGKSFLTDGIGSATVDAYTDGDTTRFRLADGQVVIIRYYEINTPESTSNVEKWGKAASKFTESILKSATEIVLEATGDRAVHDSYGTRYLGYVWYKTAESDAFHCLNLAIVENGFSDDKGVNTDEYPYYSYFHKANQFAKAKKIHIYSDAADPLYSTDPIPMTIKEFKENPDRFYDEDNKVGATVSLDATLTDLYIAKSGTYNFTVTEADPETKQTYSMALYAGYSSSAASTMKIGQLYHFIGNIDKYNGTFQIAGIIYEEMLTHPKYTKTVQKDYYLTFDSSEEYTTNLSKTLYTDATVVSSFVEGGKLTIVATAQKRDKNGPVGDAITFTFSMDVAESFTNVYTEGSTFSARGYQFVEGSGNVDIFASSQLSKKSN